MRETVEQVAARLMQLTYGIEQTNYASRLYYGYILLVQLRDGGMSQKEVYGFLLQRHNQLQEGLNQSYVATLIDFVCGWVGNPQYYVWREDGQFARVLDLRGHTKESNE